MGASGLSQRQEEPLYAAVEVRLLALTENTDKNMSNRALKLYESARPLESLESFIFRVAQRVSRGGPPLLQLREVSNNEGSLEFSYDVEEKAAVQPEEWGALSGFAVAAALTVRALVTRQKSHILSAVQATSLALAFGGREIPRLSRRVMNTGKIEKAVLGIRSGQLYLKTGGEEVWVDLAPVTSLTVRTFRFHWDSGLSNLHFAQLEMQDGRLLTIAETQESMTARRLVHQLVKPVPVELNFQNIDLYREGDKVSWELGPRLVEPALN